MSNKSKQRYILHKADESNGPKICAFFLTDKGCKSGSNCKFLHSTTSIQLPTSIPSTPIPPPTISPPIISNNNNNSNMNMNNNNNIIQTLPISLPNTNNNNNNNNNIPNNNNNNNNNNSDKKKRKSSENSENDNKKQKAHHETNETVVNNIATPSHNNNNNNNNNNKGAKTPKTPKTPQTQTTPKGQDQNTYIIQHSLPVTPFQSKRTSEEEEESDFLFSVVNTALIEGQIQSPQNLSQQNHPKGDIYNNFELNIVDNNSNKNNNKNNNNNNKTPQKTKKSPAKPQVHQLQQAPFQFQQQQQPQIQQNHQLHLQQQIQFQQPQQIQQKQVQQSQQNSNKILNNSTIQQQQQQTQQSFLPLNIQTFPFAPTNLSNSQQSVKSPVTTTTVATTNSTLDSSSPPTPIPIPPVDPRVTDWIGLVERSVNHPRYLKEYSFATDTEWIQAKPYGDWCKNLPPMIALDCEMCETSDPVTGVKNTSALVRVSIVDGLTPTTILLDTLVSPTWPISEMRTRIHGISQDNLNGVTFTLRHAQAFLMNICSDRTILVGHALHHDLRALKFNHKAVIDTSYLYSIENEPNSLLSLRDIAKHLFESKLSLFHDSIQDAQVSMMLAVHVKNNGTPDPIPRPVNLNNHNNHDDTMLFIHRLPPTITEDNIREMIISLTHIAPVSVNSIQFSATSSSNSNNNNNSNNNTVALNNGIGSSGKTTVVFSSNSHANLCFETLPGPERPDKGNRPQKRVYLKGGGYICVRKAV